MRDGAPPTRAHSINLAFNGRGDRTTVWYAAALPRRDTIGERLIRAGIDLGNKGEA